MGKTGLSPVKEVFQNLKYVCLYTNTPCNLTGPSVATFGVMDEFVRVTLDKWGFEIYIERFQGKYNAV